MAADSKRRLTFGPPRAAVVDLRVCGLCMEEYLQQSDMGHTRTAHVLPTCGHSFCCDCIITVSSGPVAQALCPTCRKPFPPLSSHPSLAHYPRNYQLESLADAATVLDERLDAVKAAQKAGDEASAAQLRALEAALAAKQAEIAALNAAREKEAEAQAAVGAKLKARAALAAAEEGAQGDTLATLALHPTLVPPSWDVRGPCAGSYDVRFTTNKLVVAVTQSQQSASQPPVGLGDGCGGKG